MVKAEAIRVLLVDDDEDQYVLTRDLLAEAEGVRFQLDWVDNYDAGLAAMEQAQHDAYLLDYRLGGQTGLELLRNARDSGCRAPAIMLTGLGDREIDLAAMSAGAADYLEKTSSAPRCWSAPSATPSSDARPSERWRGASATIGRCSTRCTRTSW